MSDSFFLTFCSKPTLPDHKVSNDTNTPNGCNTVNCRSTNIRLGKRMRRLDFHGTPNIWSDPNYYAIYDSYVPICCKPACHSRACTRHRGCYVLVHRWQQCTLAELGEWWLRMEIDWILIFDWGAKCCLTFHDESWNICENILIPRTDLWRLLYGKNI